LSGNLKTVLERKADEMRLDPRIPRGVLRRARRRRVSIAVVTGAVVTGVVVGGLVGGRLLLEATATGTRETRPALPPSSSFYPYIYPETRELFETTLDEVSQGSMQLWTTPEGAAHLFAVNVLGWEPEDVEVEVQGATAVIRNPALPEAARFEGGLATTLLLSQIPEVDPAIYVVEAATAEFMDVEPVGRDGDIGSSGELAFRGRLAMVPDQATVVLSHVDPEGQTTTASSPVEPDGTFEVAVDTPSGIDPSSLVSIAVQDGSGRTLALTSARIISPELALSGPTMVELEPIQALPGPVAETRDRLLAAAESGDWEALRSLIPPDGFSFTFGEENDPIAYWQRLEREGVPILSHLRALLSVVAADNGDWWVWPATAAKDPTEWTPEDAYILGELVDGGVLTEEEREDYLRFGYYYGWRIGIDHEGTWRFFIAGD
jgi:hypothetical protein